MKILNAQQIREWDQYTIQYKPVSSIDLMERAASQCVQWLEEKDLLNHSFKIFCGKGNNGGDGLAMARMLSQKARDVAVFILEFGHLGTDDSRSILNGCISSRVEIKFIQTEQQFPFFEKMRSIIDALFGSGLNRPLEGVTANLVEHINNSGCKIIAIDTPSGLPIDHSAEGKTIIKADHTLSFQVFKLSFLLPENANFIGKVHILDIGLHPEFYDSAETSMN
jgi:NAD(P)H-hydrate epimerase